MAARAARAYALDMFMRLLIGLLKGIAVGTAIGAAFQLGLGWATVSGLLGFLIAMGTGATAGVLVGKPPWKQDGWIEGVLKAVFGVGVGALVYWLSSSYGKFDVPFAIGEAPAGTDWTTVPLLFAPIVAALYGALVEVDNTGDEDASAKKKGKAPPKPASKARVDLGLLDDLDEEPATVAAKQAKKRSR